MSSMLSLKRPLLPIAAATLALSATLISGPCSAQDAQRWDQARSNLVAQQPTGMAQAISRWQQLTDSRNMSFDAYAGFVLTYPNFPRESLLRVRAENRLDNEAPSSDTLIAYFDRKPPLTNSGRARYALALGSAGRQEASDIARQAWRGGTMSETSEAYIQGLYGQRFSAEDHIARMDALLWQRNADGAVRQMINVPESTRDLFMARLALIKGSTPSAAGLPVPGGALSDPGYVYNLARYYRCLLYTSDAADE